jgi:hypothetical protein
MEIEGGVFTNLKLNGMVNSFPPFMSQLSKINGSNLPNNKP